MKFILIILTAVFFTTSCSSQNKIGLEPQAFSDSINAPGTHVILDVRTPEEYSKGFIGNAKNVDIRGEDFETVINKMDRNQPYYVYCLSGGRSSSAVDYMKQKGFTNVHELNKGIMAWRQAKLPLTEVGDIPDKISFEDYENMVADGKVLIDFYAPWCGPCRQMEGMLKKITNDYEGKVKVIRINIDENKMLSDKLGVMEIPYFKLYEEKKPVWNYTGLISEKELRKVLK